MGAYILKRLGLIFPTLLGVLIINFFIIQIAPGGPIEHLIAKFRGGMEEMGGMEIGMDVPDVMGGTDLASNTPYAGARGLPPEFIKELEIQFGFDKPMGERLWILLKNYFTFDFGNSYFRDTSVSSLIKEKLPVSISLGLWSTLLIYLIAIPLGIRKAAKNGSKFDLFTSAIMVVSYSIPSFLIALLLIILFAGGTFLDLFPLRGLVSDNWADLTWYEKVGDYIWHLILPIASVVIGGLASLTMLSKNSFLEEMQKQYVVTARSKGVPRNKILYKHIFRNAILVVVSRFPSTFIHIFFTSNLLIEVIFSLDGMGLLGFEAAINRDYPVMFATLYIFTLISLVLHLVGDIIYSFIDPRIDFGSRGAK